MYKRQDITASETQQLLTLISYIIQHDKIDVILFEDYNKGLITPRLITKVVELAKSKGIPTCVDPKTRNFSAYKGVTLFKPNLKELREGLKMDISSDNINELQRAISSFRAVSYTHLDVYKRQFSHHPNRWIYLF